MKYLVKGTIDYTVTIRVPVTIIEADDADGVLEQIDNQYVPTTFCEECVWDGHALTITPIVAEVEG